MRISDWSSDVCSSDLNRLPTWCGVGCIAGEVNMTAAMPDQRAKRDPSTHFVFEHRVFRLPDARFELSGRERGPVLRVKLGELEAVVPIDDVTSEFGIRPDSTDGRLLVPVGQARRSEEHTSE